MAWFALNSVPMAMLAPLTANAVTALSAVYQYRVEQERGLQYRIPFLNSKALFCDLRSKAVTVPSVPEHNTELP